MTGGSLGSHHEDINLSDSASPSLFRLPEYDAATTSFVYESIRALAVAKSPVLQMVQRETVAEVTASRVTLPSGEAIELLPVDVTSEFTWTISASILGDFDGLYDGMDSAARQSAAAIVSNIVRHLELVTDAIGNTVHAHGEPISHELILETLEKIEMSFDDDGNPIGLAIVASPEMARKISALPPPTPAQDRAFRDLMARKREEFNARRRHRRLS